MARHNLWSIPHFLLCSTKGDDGSAGITFTHGADGVPEALILLLQIERELDMYSALLALNVHILHPLQNWRKGRLRILD